MSAVSLPPVYIYSSQRFGVSFECAKQMGARLEGYGVAGSRIIPLPDESYLSRELKNRLATLLLPGGSTLSMAMGLRGNIGAIKRAVDQGWNLLGSCAGANLACSRMSIDMPAVHRGKMSDIKDLEQEHGYPLFHLLPIHAHSPAYAVTELTSGGANNVRRISVISELAQKTIPVMWSEGSIFTPFPNATGLQVEARYADVAGACAISGRYGKGSVLITAVHPELVEDSNDRPQADTLLKRFFDFTVFSEQSTLTTSAWRSFYDPRVQKMDRRCF